MEKKDEVGGKKGVVPESSETEEAFSSRSHGSN